MKNPSLTNSMNKVRAMRMACLLVLFSFLAISNARAAMIIVWYDINGVKHLKRSPFGACSEMTYNYQPDGPVSTTPAPRCYDVIVAAPGPNGPCALDQSIEIGAYEEYTYYYCASGVFSRHNTLETNTFLYEFSLQDSTDLANGQDFTILFDQNNEVPISFQISDPDYSIFEGGQPKMTGPQSSSTAPKPQASAMIMAQQSLPLIGIGITESTPYAIFDMSGKAIARGTLAVGNQNLSIASIPNGSYILSLPIHGQMRTLRFTKSE